MVQKTAGGLYLHNWLHSQNSIPFSADKPAIGQNILSCSCINDFYLPFAEAPEQLVQNPCAVKNEFIVSLKSLVPSCSKFFHSLRGPPTQS
jgi:hypothetical protein